MTFLVRSFSGLLPRIDAANPLALGLVFLTLPGQFSGKDLVQGRHPTRAGYTFGASPYGNAATLAAGAGNRLDYGTYAAIPINSSTYTIGAVAKPAAAATSSVIYYQGLVSGRFTAYALSMNSNNLPTAASGRFALYEYDSGTKFAVNSLAGAVDGNWHVFIVQRAAISVGDCYLDGVAQGSALNPSLPSETISNTSPLTVGGGSGSTQVANYPVALVCAWARALLPAEILAFSRNPWQLFAPFPSARTYSFPVGAIVAPFMVPTIARQAVNRASTY